jgi:DNA-binding transcriptional MerR regulator
VSPATSEPALRIGEVAEQTGTTPRTIRYYEEIGLLPGSRQRSQGKHRVYDAADVERLEEIVRLRDLLGLPLEELRALLEAEDARAALRREWHATEDPDQRRRILGEALSHVERQIGLVRARREEIATLEGQLEAKRVRLRERLAEL